MNVSHRACSCACTNLLCTQTFTKQLSHWVYQEAPLGPHTAMCAFRSREGSISCSAACQVAADWMMRLYTRSLLNRFMSLVTRRPSLEQDKDSVSIEKLEEVRRAIRLGVLCCELTKGCLDRAGDVLRDFSMRLSIAATKYLLLIHHQDTGRKVCASRYKFLHLCAHARQIFAHTHSLTHMHAYWSRLFSPLRLKRHACDESTSLA
jgi:hypothetical protein